MFSRYKRISKQLYDWCVKSRLVDAVLVAKWKRPGYERLCSTFVINPKNFNYGTTSICRVPKQNLAADGKAVVSNATGCLGCASGPGGFTNIFGNKYGQNLADIQMCRERGKLKEAGLWSEAVAAKEWQHRAGERGGKQAKGKRNRLELLALEANGEVWATEEEEQEMLRAKKGIESEAAADTARAEAVTMAHAAAAAAAAASSASASASSAAAHSGTAAHGYPLQPAAAYSQPGYYPPMGMQPQHQQSQHQQAAPPQTWSMGAYTTILNHSAEGKAAAEAADAAAAAAETASADEEATAKRGRAADPATAEQAAGSEAAPEAEAEAASADAEMAAPAEAKRAKVAESASAE
jgi:bud site selection protein 31